MSFDPTSSQSLEPDQAWLSIQHADGTHSHVRLSTALTTVGRSEQNVIELLDPKLSRFHCEVERGAQGYQVRDCNSRNGTQLNGQPIGSATPLLNEGDTVRIGRTNLTFSTQRPDDLRSDRAVPLTVTTETVDELDVPTAGDTPFQARRRPTENHPAAKARGFDARNTQAVEALGVRRRNPWQILAEATQIVLRATHRRELLEGAVGQARLFFESHGALIALGRGADGLSVTASDGVSEEALARCEDVAGRAVIARAPIEEGRHAIGVPLLSGDGRVIGALVLSNLNSTPSDDSKELETLTRFAEVVAHTLTTSLLVEEVRREERAAGARRLAQDLRGVLRPAQLDSLPRLALARVTTRGEQVERSFWDRVEAPARAGRQETYLALGDVPDPEGEAPKRLRRRGERAFVSLMGQAELRGSLRALVEVMPRTSDLLAQLNGALLRESSVDRSSLLLIRYDSVKGVLRFSGGGHAPVLIRRAAGTVEQIDAVAPSLGAAETFRTAEHEIALEPDDQVLFLTLGAVRVPRATTETLAGIFGRVGGPALEAEIVAQRFAEGVLDQSTTPTPEGFTVLLARRTE